MKTYKALRPVNLMSGQVSVSADQARRRAHALIDERGHYLYALDEIDAGVYQIAERIQFKAGEEFGYDGEIAKSDVHDVELISHRSKAPASMPGPKHVGAGVFELPDGTRVRGKEAAQAAMDDQ